MDIQKACEAFRVLLEEQQARIANMNSQKVDFTTKQTVTIGIIDGDGIGPVIMEQAVAVLEKLVKDDIDQGPKSHLCKIRDFQSSLTCGSQGIFVKKHGEDVKSVLEQKEGCGRGDISCLLIEPILDKDSHILFVLKKKKKLSRSRE